MYKINRLQCARGCLISFLSLLQVPSFLNLILFTQTMPTPGAPSQAGMHLTTASNTISDFIFPEEVILHVIGVIFVWADTFYFYVYDHGNFMLEASCLCLQTYSRIWGIFSLPAEGHSVCASILTVIWHAKLKLSWEVYGSNSCIISGRQGVISCALKPSSSFLLAMISITVFVTLSSWALFMWNGWAV